MKDVVFRAGKRLAIEVVVVANRRVEIPAAYPTARALVVAGKADEADRVIVAQSAPGDLVITADVPLAAQLVRNGVAAIDQRGEEHSDGDVGNRLVTRNILEELRGAGVRTGGPTSTRTSAPAQTFDRVIAAARGGAARPGAS